MRIGVMSDSHDDVELIRRAVEIFNNQGVALVLHAGDIFSSRAAQGFHKLRSPFAGICGNYDTEWQELREAFAPWGQVYQGYYDFKMEGRRLALMHGLGGLHRLPPTKRFDVIIYGHSHHFDVREGPPLFLNPGQCSHRVEGEATVAVLDLGTLHVEKFVLDGRAPTGPSGEEEQ
jgi:hypothetical protein